MCTDFYEILILYGNTIYIRIIILKFYVWGNMKHIILYYYIHIYIMLYMYILIIYIYSFNYIYIFMILNLQLTNEWRNFLKY